MVVVPLTSPTPMPIQWFVSRDFPTGVPSSNGTTIPILIPSFPSVKSNVSDRSSDSDHHRSNIGVC